MSSPGTYGQCMVFAAVFMASSPFVVANAHAGGAHFFGAGGYHRIIGNRPLNVDNGP